MRKSTKTARIESAEEPAVTVITPDAPVLETPPAVEPEVEVAAVTAEDGLGKLTEKEAAELARQEAVVKEHENGFWTMVNALKVIHEQRLYRATHKTFKDYCLERWNFDRAHGDRWVKASVVYENLKCLHGGDVPLPVNEAQVRPLTRLNPDKHEAVWREVVEKAAGAPITMKLVEEVAKPYLPVPKARAADAVVVDVAPVAETHEAETMRLLTRLEEILRDHENQRAIEALARLREEIVNELKEAA